jgi:3-dehydroquinate synthase
MEKKLKHQDCNLWFGTDLNESLDALLKNDYSESKKIIITDENVYDIWIENLITSTESLHQAEIIQLPAGENTKTIEFCYQIWETLTDYKVKRNDVIINFGGGVITDLGSFVASTFKRGVPFINIPTTLLAQVDASVGGKTGIDLEHHKNQIGTYALPDNVFIDDKYLTTLPQQELISGFAEMLKHALIKDKVLWEKLSNIKKITPETLKDYIYNAVLIKKNIVENDFKENGERKLLNFGHTIGHAFESWFLKQNKNIPHGYAVAWGILSEAMLSHQKKLLSSKALIEIELFINKHFPICTVSKKEIDQLLDLMKNDKKNNTQKINFTLLSEIGIAHYNNQVNVNEVELVLNKFLK